MQWTAAGQCCDSFINQGQFKAIKTLKSRTAPRCDKHQFRVKVKKERKNISCLVVFWRLIGSLADHKGNQRR